MQLSQAEAAELLGVDQPKVSALKRGRISGFSLQRLVRFLINLGLDVTWGFTWQHQSFVFSSMTASGRMNGCTSSGFNNTTEHPVMLPQDRIARR